jgi:hypothetical protein
MRVLLSQAGVDALDRLATAIATGVLTNTSLLLLGAEVAGSLAGGNAIAGETSQLMPSEYIDPLKGAAALSASEGPGVAVGDSVSDQMAPTLEAFRAQRAGMLKSCGRGCKGPATRHGREFTDGDGGLEIDCRRERGSGLVIYSYPRRLPT